MSQPFEFTAANPEEFTKRDPSELIPMGRCKGVLLIVRPLKYQESGFKTVHKDDTDALFADIANLDPIPGGWDDMGNQLPAFPAGMQFRDQILFQGYLKGTFKRYLGKTLIGTIYFEPSGKGKPSMKWQDLSADAQCVARGQQFMAAHPEFLIPTQGQFSAAQEPAYGYQGYQQPPQSAPAAPVQSSGYQGYQQPDPWAAQAAPVSAQPTSPAPTRPMTTLEQMRHAGQINHQGQPQSSDVPF